MPATDLPGWGLLFNDDFQSDVARGSFPGPLFTRWDAYPSPWRDSSKRGTYSPEVVSVHDGLMDIYLHTVEGVIKVAAPLPLIHGRGGSAAQLYGRYAVRFKADAVTGYKLAWLLWPESGSWPRDGEIDFPEGNLDGTIHGFVHRQGATTGADQDIFPTTASFTDWHTAVIEWAPDRCEFFLDGVSLGKATDRIPETAMHWVIQTETALSGDAPAPTAEGHVYLDWVAVWAYAP